MEPFDERIPAGFWKKVVVDEAGCWRWCGSKTRDGHGIAACKVDGKWGSRLAHRYVYQTLVEKVPEGLVCDHLCEVTCCVNPGHLQIVTQRVNVLRSRTSPTAKNARKTHCARGHEYAEGSYYRTRQGGRQCRACHAEDSSTRRASFNPEKRAAVLRRQRERMEVIRRMKRLGVGGSEATPKDY